MFNYSSARVGTPFVTHSLTPTDVLRIEFLACQESLVGCLLCWFVVHSSVNPRCMPPAWTEQAGKMIDTTTSSVPSCNNCHYSSTRRSLHSSYS